MTNQTAEFCDPDVGDLTAPDITSVLVNNLPSVLVNEGDMVFLTIAITDVGYGGSNVAGAEWMFDTCGPWPGNNTNAQTPPWGDQTSEVGTYNIDTSPLTQGVTYTVYARAWDVPLNYNEDCLVTAQISIIGVGDNAAPNILNPLAAPTRTAPGTSVVFTADIDDSSTGNSFVMGANYSINPPALSFPMNAQNAPFGDSETEPAAITIDTTGWPDGPHDLCVVDAWDSSDNSYSGLPVCATVDIDGTAPSVENVMLNGTALSYTANQGDLVDLTATLNDALTGGSTIANASYSMTPGGPSGAMAAVDGTFDGISENVEALAIDTSTMAGAYTVCVFGADEVGNVRIDDPCMTLTVVVPDVDAPTVQSVLVDGLASKQVLVGDPFAIEANVDDTIPLTGPNLVANASYEVRNQTTGAQQAVADLEASDGSFDSTIEVVRTAPATPVDTTGWPLGFYDVYVYACDIVPNCGWGGTPATVEITDVVSTTITLTATVDDTNTNNSNIGGANYTVGAAAWPSTAMNAVNAPYDNPSEDVTVDVTVSAWTAGTYDLCVYGSDVAGNNNLTGACVTVTVTAPVVGNAPVIGTVVVTPTSPEEGDRVTLSAPVTDVEDPAGNLTVTITIVSPNLTPIATNAPMSATGDTFSYETAELSTPGTYAYTVTATDSDGNIDLDIGTFTVEEVEEEPDGIALWMWLLILIIIIVVVVLIIFAATRKKPEEEIMEAPPEEEELPPEEEFPPEEEAFVEEEPVEEAVIEEEAPEEVVEEVPPEEVAEEPATFEEAEPEPVEEAAPEESRAEEAPAEEEAAPGGPISCPNCGTVNPEGISVCTSCGSPL
jgi:hypothetical protein